MTRAVGVLQQYHWGCKIVLSSGIYIFTIFRSVSFSVVPFFLKTMFIFQSQDTAVPSLSLSRQCHLVSDVNIKLPSRT